ncbi:cytochrome C biogenesis protein CcsA [Stutzerimonas nosocomialis]|uniref:c-type cytochrome n=1 Tax=Stutzerimonas nosocomialis TaxID=1056496 RepID=UPI001109945B|nr:c-type cytochrome [Stutzerimonas nosocomialis]TLX56828.1 cytochrome C biogenesis protein CcsA [Stutzerimonas nosocomialis]
MKKVLIPLLTLGAAALLQQSALAASGEVLFKTKGCAACHSIDTKLVGPSYKQVAAKYAGDGEAVTHLSDTIKNGVQGQWGPIPMPPNPVSDEEARTLAEWVLTHQ